MLDYNLFSQHMSDFCQSGTRFIIIFIPRPVTTGYDRFFVVFCGPGPQFLDSKAFWDWSGSWSFQKRQYDQDRTGL